MAGHRGSIHFLGPEDADEITKALEAEGYTVRPRADEHPSGRSRWVLDVEPFDDGVVALVDVYGGFLDDEL